MISWFANYITITRDLHEHNRILTVFFRLNAKKKANLVEAIENKMISIDSVECNTKFSADITETSQITPEKFIESIQFLNETIFKDAIDFYYEFTGANSILIECGMKNQFMEEYYRVECSVCDGISAKEVDKKLRETVFDRMDKKIAV